jgi:hypothetical protein
MSLAASRDEKSSAVADYHLIHSKSFRTKSITDRLKRVTSPAWYALSIVKGENAHIKACILDLGKY